MNSELDRLFAHPDPRFSPAPLWWWSGEKVTEERLTWQLEQLASQGVFNVVVINLAPAGPLASAPADDPAWFSEEWWALFERACATCERLGMRIWFYDQIGFSGANLQGRLTLDTPEHAGAALHRRQVAVSDGQVPVPAGASVVAAYAPDGRRLALDGDRLLDPDQREVLLVHTLPTAYDYLSPSACAALLDFVHGEFERRMPGRLGQVIAGSFQDELPLHNSWTPLFAEEFAKRRGYDLLDHLPALWDPSTERNSKVLGDYYRTRAELAEEAFFRPLGEWHRRHGMLLGSDQMNPARSGYPIQSTQFYSDYFATHRWYNAAGSDHEGDAKIHSSMAHLYDHERVWIEAFHSSGWGATLEDTYDWLLPFFQSGANLYNPHAVYYAMTGGWFEWAAPSTDWRQPYWGQYGAFADAVSRICSLLTWGSPLTDVAVLYPTATVQARLPLDAPVEHFNADRPGEGLARLGLASVQERYLELVGENDWFEHKPGALRQAAVEYDIVDEPSVRSGTTDAGDLVVKALRYRWLVLAECAVLETGTAQALSAHLDAGGRVAFLGEAPRVAAEYDGDDDLVRRLTQHPGAVRFDSAGELAAALAAGPRRLQAPVPVLARTHGADGIAFVPAASPNAHAYPLRRDGEPLWEDYDFDPARYADNVTLTLQGTPGSVELWNPATGERRPAAFRRVGASQDATEITVDLGGAPAQLVVWSAEPRPVPQTTVPAHRPRTLALDGPWTGTLVDTLGPVNAWGDLAKPDGCRPLPQIWEFEHAVGESAPDGDDGWSPVRAGFGPHGIVLPPSDRADLPAPLTPQEAANVLAGRQRLGSPQDGDWTPVEYSDSRGVHKDVRHRSTFGPKGRVPEEFLTLRAPSAGQAVRLRTIVIVPEQGPLELLLGSGTAKRVWWNGELLDSPAGPGDPYLLRTDVVAAARNVLELELSEWRPAPETQIVNGATLDAFWALARPGDYPQRPEFITTTAGPGGHDTRLVREFDLDAVPETAELVAGAAVELTLRLNGVLVARQAKVEYYVDWGAAPAFFTHQVRDLLREGTNVLEAVLHTADPTDVLLIDLALEGPDGTRTVVTDADWSGEFAGVPHPVRCDRGPWGDPALPHVRRRPHPLPATDWLSGPPQLGRPTVRTEATAELATAAQWFRLTLPLGSVSATVPLRGRVRAWLDGDELTVEQGSVLFGEPLTRPTTLLVTSTGADLTGGTLWDGPVEVETAPVPTPLGDWRDLGLGSWSGGLEYRTRLDLPADLVGRAARLHLGELRGSVSVEVNGRSAGDLFCRPWAVDIGHLLREGANDVVVRVFNTLAPHLDANSPTTFVYPSQLASGLLGPVVVEVS